MIWMIQNRTQKKGIFSEFRNSQTTKASFWQLKISEFLQKNFAGLTRKEDTMVKHFDTTTEYHAPELCDCLMKEQYAVQKSVDVWAVGILIYFSLRGRYPWEKASIMAKPYWEWEEWMKGKRSQLPNRWSRFTEKGLKLFRKTLAPKEADRCSIKSIIKTMSSRWSKETKGMVRCLLVFHKNYHLININRIFQSDRKKTQLKSETNDIIYIKI